MQTQQHSSTSSNTSRPATTDQIAAIAKQAATVAGVSQFEVASAIFKPPAATSGADGGCAVKKTKTQRRFTRVEKTVLEERLKNRQLDDKKGREDVAALLSADGKPLSAEQVRIWIDNFRASMKRKKTAEDKQSEQ
jgi:hypothetical protein